MRWIVIGVGRLKEPFFRQGCAEYLARLQRRRSVGLIEVDEVPSKAGDAYQAARSEGERLRKAAGQARIVALCERGESLTTAKFASRLELLEREPGDLAFLLGGPAGLDPQLEKQAIWRLALSHFTLPYQLARLVLLEQLYRAETLRRGEPYHRADSLIQGAPKSRETPFRGNDSGGLARPPGPPCCGAKLLGRKSPPVLPGSEHQGRLANS